MAHAGTPAAQSAIPIYLRGGKVMSGSSRLIHRPITDLQEAVNKIVAGDTILFDYVNGSAADLYAALEQLGYERG